METNETNKGKYSKTHFFKTKKKLKRRNKIESKQKRKTIQSNERKTYLKKNVICVVSSNFKPTSKQKYMYK